MTTTVATAQERRAPAGLRDPRRLIILALVLGYVANVAWRLWLDRGIHVPIAHTDEDSYLNPARVLGGGPGGFSSGNGILRRAGYPLLISPAFWFAHDFFFQYRIVQVINALLNSTVLPLAYLLLRRVLNVSRWPAFAIALAAATMPAAVFYATSALTDVVMAPLTLAWFLLLYLWLRTPERTWLAIGTGAVVGAFYTIHVRGLVIVGVYVLITAYLAVRGHLPRRKFWQSMAAMVAVCALNYVLLFLLRHKLQLVGNPPGSSTLTALVHAGGLSKFLGSAVAQLWYLLVVTFGLAGVGWLAALREFRRPTRDSAYRWTMISALLATIATALGAAFILASVVGNHDAIYARYVSMLVPFWLCVGLAVLYTLTTRAAVRAWVFTVAVVGVLGVLTALRVWHAAHQGRPLAYGGFGAVELEPLTNGWSELKAITGTIVAIVGLALIIALARSPRLRVALIGLIVVVNLWSMNWLNTRFESAVVARSTWSPTLSALGVHAPDRVASTYGFDYVLRINMAHEVTWTAVVNFQEKPPANADVVIARWHPGQPDDWDGTQYGLHRVGGNADQGWAVWRR
jgi:hypothetical protein